MRFFIAHASITVIHIHPDGSVALDKMGDCGHLPVNMVDVLSLVIDNGAEAV